MSAATNGAVVASMSRRAEREIVRRLQEQGAVDRSAPRR